MLTCATAIEYGLIAGLRSVTIIPAVGALGNKLKTTFTRTGNALTNPPDRVKRVG